MNISNGIRRNSSPKAKAVLSGDIVKRILDEGGGRAKIVLERLWILLWFEEEMWLIINVVHKQPLQLTQCNLFLLNNVLTSLSIKVCFAQRSGDALQPSS